MPRRVKGPDGIVRNFPDDATDQEISEALGTPPATPRGQHERTWTDTAVDALPAIGGTLGGVVGGIGGTAFGMGVGGVPGAVGGAALGGGAGEAAKQLINRARGAEAPTSATEAAGDIALQGGVQGAAELAGAGVAQVAKTGAKAVYRGYLKPALSQRMLPKANQIVDTALKEALPVTRGGVQAGQRVIGELRTQVDDILKQSPESIDLHDIARQVRAFAKQRYYRPGADLTDYQTALSVADKIDAHPSLAMPAPAMPRTNVPLSEGNQVKRALDTSIGEAAFGTTSGAKKSTEKFARSAMRQGLEAKAPAIVPLNARESALIDVTKTIARAVEREANQNPLYGMKTIASGALGAGGLAAGSLGPAGAAVTAIASRIALDPAVASRAAIVAERLAKELGIGASAAARLAVTVVSEQGEQDGEADVAGPQ